MTDGNITVGNIQIKLNTVLNNTLATLDKINNKMTTLNSKINNVGNSTNKLDKLNNGLKKTNNQLKKNTNNAQKFNKSLNFATILGKVYFLLNYFKRLGTAVGNMANEAINFYETSNKFQVAMGDNYAQAIKFVDNLTTAFNLSTESVMNYQATFMNMLSALGNLDNDVSYMLSERLTLMAIDYASLFNVSIESAMSQFQSALSGQVRSIRTTSGFDITERTLYSLYQELGGQKTMRQLTQLEKRLLIILALQKQLEETGAIFEEDGKIVGDFSKTITSTSNKIKQISETFKEIGRWAGQLMLVFVDPFVDKLLVASLTLKEMLKSLAYAQGYKPPDFAIIKENSEDTEENTDNILENVEQLEKKLLGFDKLNILGETSSNELSTELDLITNALGEFNYSFENANKEMKEASENLMRWLGYVQVIETYTTKTGDTIETTVWKLQEGDTRLKNIVSTIVGLGSTLATIGLVKKIDKIAIAIGTSKETGILGAVSKISSTIGGWIAVIAVLVTGFINLYNKSDDFATSVNKSVDSIIQNFGRFFNIISNIIEKIWNSSAFQSLLDAIGYILKVALDLVDISVAIGSFNWVDLGSKFSQLGNDLWNGVIGNLAHALNSVLTAFIDNVGKPIINFFNEKVGPAIKRIFYTVVGAIVGFFERMINYIVDGINWVLGGVSDVWEFLGGDPIEKVGYVNWTDKFNDKMATSAPIIEAGQLGTQTAISTLDPETQQQWSQQVDQDMANFVGVISQSVAQSVLPLVQAVVSGNADLKEAITELAERPIELNGRKVSESIYDDLKEVQNRKGTSY